MTPDLIVIYEHPEWQKPLFAALERRGLSFAAYDQAATQQDELAPRKNGVEVHRCFEVFILCRYAAGA
jgi:hypothetical protein